MTTRRPEDFVRQRLTRRGVVHVGGLGVAAVLGGGAVVPGAAQEATPLASAEDGLSAEIIELLDELPGTKGFAFWAPLDAGRPAWSISQQPDRQMFIASAFKAFVLAECLRQAEAALDPQAATPLAGQLDAQLQEELALDERVFTLGSPIFNPPNLTGKVTVRTALQAMILESDDTAADMLLRHVGPERVRGLIADLGLQQTRIPDSTRQFIGYLFGDPTWQTLTWAQLQPLVAKAPYPPRRAINDVITMASSADNLVSFYTRALHGEIFRYPETLVVFRAMLSLKDSIAQIFPLGVNTFVKGGSFDAFADHALSVAGGMYVAQRWLYFALILNWSDAEAGDVASVVPTFLEVTRTAFTTIRDRLSA